MNEFEGKVAVVTGAGRGIGAATARKLAGMGAAVAVVDLAGSAVAEDISRNGGKATFVACDVTDPSAVESMVETVVGELGSVDILVNNAGIIRDDLLFKMSVNDWDAVMNTHLRGNFLCSKAVQSHMVERKWGRIINLSSTSAKGSRGQANYAAAKAGIQGFTRTLAIELGRYGITANAVAPGFIETEMTRSVAERTGVDFDDMKAAAEKEIAVRRVGRPEDIANVVAFLAGDDASYVTGQVIYVSGSPD
ncbi:SDR family oxidoreductase [Gordonia sp. SID5947]|uniref:SDR family NAD(P)-dependent oxidoreductase n=1 Tax=Gordonia sp. SID5947 TaxID=2690315 RepID=UPI00136A59CF|nr:3-oxoacyl-ACP reductase FabG [Gordonia sp. SID5947]MYR08002.1 SDR family oxidoreductase [Gordonia sp. SID5947]